VERMMAFCVFHRICGSGVFFCHSKVSLWFIFPSCAWRRWVVRRIYYLMMRQRTMHLLIAYDLNVTDMIHLSLEGPTTYSIYSIIVSVSHGV
jgi:hypothetical protein